jgi:uncharacterized protein (TIGR03435 family)
MAAPMRMTRMLWLAAILLALQFVPAAQSVEFDVASVKEGNNLSDVGVMRLMPGGGITAQHLPALRYVTVAYQLLPFQLVGAPDWTRNTYYDIVAKSAGPATREQTFAMLQTLLIERFKLTFHREKRQMDGFALVRARANELGPGLRPSTVNCEKEPATVPKCREGRIAYTAAVNTMTLVGAPIWSLLQQVINSLGTPVSDDTRLAGTFDIDLRWSNDVAPADDLQSIFAALQDQLGLKLERRRVTVDVFIVDRIERPMPD